MLSIRSKFTSFFAYNLKGGGFMEIYIVKANDTLENIANLYGVPASEIIKANNLIYPYTLSVGQPLNIPTGMTNIFDYYLIQKNDTLYSIANKSNTSVDILAAINGLSVNDYIYPNQTLLIPKKGITTYITKMGDTIQSVAKMLNTIPQGLVFNNNNIYLLPEQLIVFRN